MVQVYVDDFGGVEKTKEEALESFHSMGNLLKELGLEEGVDKAQGPTQEMTYLGITYNTKEGTIKVGDAMMQRLKKALEMVEGKEEHAMMQRLKKALEMVEGK